MEHLQSIARQFFRAFVVAMVILNYDPKAVYALPLGLLVGLCSEAVYLTSKKKKEETKP